MSAIQNQPPVFWIEADEEATLLHPETQATIGRRSLLAYLLLRRSIIAHPADFWQSRHTNNLIANVQAQPLLKDAMRIQLGDSATIREYMENRIDKLKRDKASSQRRIELPQYENYGANLIAQSDQLDDVFTRSGSTFPASESRDKKFRRLIRQDLQCDIPNGLNLSRCIRQVLRRREADQLIKTLSALADDSRRFISIDGIVSRLENVACPKSMLEIIHRRLLVLHWEARGHGNIELPLLSRSIFNRLDSSDPEVFWIAVDHLIGRDFQIAMMTLPWQSAIMIAHQLRADSLWGNFIETYHIIVESVERDHVEIAEAIVISKLGDQYPQFRQVLWANKPDKWTVLSWVCHAGSWVVGIPTGLGLLFRLGSGVVAIKKSYEQTAKIVNALYASERHLIASRVRTMIDDAIKIR